MSISSNLRRIRSKTDISQQEIADFVGVNRKTYESWESGEADVKSEHIPKLAEILKVGIADLFSKQPCEIVVNQNNPKMSIRIHLFDNQ